MRIHFKFYRFLAMLLGMTLFCGPMLFAAKKPTDSAEVKKKKLEKKKKKQRQKHKSEDARARAEKLDAILRRAASIKTTSPVKEQKAPVQLLAIRTEKKDAGTRIVMEFSGEPRVKRGELPEIANLPKRIYFDLSPVHLSKNLSGVLDIAEGGVKRIRSGQFHEDTARIVVELEDDATHDGAMQGHSYVVEVRSKHAEASIEPVAAPVPLAAPAPVQEQPTATVHVARAAQVQPGPRLRRIVIDPGHGGDDPGAIGRHRLREKDITLAISKLIREKLRKEIPDVKVLMTREDDRTVALPKRTQIANDAEADLFISVHVNSHNNSSVQGMETYYLNIAHDRYAIRLAARENAMSESEISNLEFILADLAMKSNVQDSIRLGTLVQSSMTSHVQQHWHDAKDLGLKHALFYVLLGARMPAILVETSFISNKEEEKRLRTDDYKEALAIGVVKGVQRYLQEREAQFVP